MTRRGDGELNLKGEYFNPDSLKLFRAALLEDALIDEVAYQESLMGILNDNLEKIAMAFMVFIALLMFISLVRKLFVTMQLFGQHC